MYTCDIKLRKWRKGAVVRSKPGLLKQTFKMFCVLTLKDHSNSQTVPRTNLWFQYEFVS